MADPLFQIPLGAQVDEFLAMTVLKVQFVGTRAAHNTAASQHTASLVLRQGVSRHVQRIGQAAVDQRPVRVALQEGHKHLHAHTWNQHGAKAIARPTGGYPYPITAFVIGGIQAVPMKTYFHSAVGVAVHFFAWGPRHDGGLAAIEGRFGVLKRRLILTELGSEKVK